MLPRPRAVAKALQQLSRLQNMHVPNSLFFKAATWPGLLVLKQQPTAGHTFPFLLGLPVLFRAAGFFFAAPTGGGP